MIRHDRTVRVLLGVLAFLLAGNLLVQVRQDRVASAAGLPDSGAQLQAQIDQLTELNKKMDKLQAFLESGKLKVDTGDNKASK